MQGVTGEWLQPCNSNPVRHAETRTAAGDAPGMEDNEKTELFWRKRSMTAESCPQIPASVLSRRSFPTPRATQSLPNGRLFALPGIVIPKKTDCCERPEGSLGRDGPNKSNQLSGLDFQPMRLGISSQEGSVVDVFLGMDVQRL